MCLTFNRTQAVQLSQNGFDVQWSPDGAQLAFLHKQEQTYQLWTVRKDGAAARPIVNSQVTFLGYAENPLGWTQPPNFSWSPDGQRLVYGAQRAEQQQLYSIAADGSDERQLTTNTDKQVRFASPLWSPNGQQFAYLGRRTGEGLKPRTVYLFDGAQSHVIWQTEENVRLLGWAKTGAAVYVAVIKGPRVVDPTTVKVFRLAATQAGVLASPELIAQFANAYWQNVALSPNAEQVVYIARQDDAENVWLASLATGQRRQLTMNTNPNLSLGCLTWASRADMVGFIKQSNATSIYVIENFK